MTIHRTHGDIHFECDTCGETFEDASENFNEVWSAAKRDGWTTKKVGNDWIHTCEACNVAQMPCGLT